MPRSKNKSNKKALASYNNTETRKIKSKYPEMLVSFTWYYLQQDKQTYIIAQLPSSKPNLAQNISLSINRFAKTNHLNLHASFQMKNNLLYFSEDDFTAYFNARKITQLTIKEATQKLKELFNDNQLTSISTTERNYLAKLPGFTWYQLEKDQRTYIVTEFPSNTPNLANYMARTINHYAKEKALPLHASYQRKNNLLYLYEDDFKAYFAATKITQPAIKEASQKLKDLFNDNQISSVSAADRNYLSQLPRFTWYQLEQDQQTYIVTELPSNKPNLANNIASAINHYGKTNALPLHASSQRKNNLLYLTEASFKYYFSSIAQNPPAVNQPSADLIAKFSMSAKSIRHRNYLSASNTPSRQLDSNLNEISVPINNSNIEYEKLAEREPQRQLEANTGKDFIDEQIDLFLESIYANWEQPIALYTRDSNIQSEGLFARKPQTQVQANDTIEISYLEQLGNIILENNDSSSITTTMQSSESPQENSSPQFCILDEFDFDASSKLNQLDKLIAFTWYYLVQDTQTYIVTQLPSTRPLFAHYLSTSINHFAKTRELRIHASSQRKNNLLYFSEEDFKAYFDAENITQPIIKEATQELKYLFNDNQISSVSVGDRNYLAQLPGFTWYQLEQNEQTYIVTELPSNNPTLANRIALAINHYAKENTLQLRGSCNKKNNLLYLTKNCFTSYFSSINQNQPAVNIPSPELIAKFALSSRRKPIRKNTATGLNEMTSPINSGDRQPLVTKEHEVQFKANNDTAQSTFLDQLSNIISGKTDGSAMTIVQSSESLTQDCTPVFDDFDFNGLYYALGLNQQAQGGNNTTDNSNNNPENTTQNSKDKLTQMVF